jgi:hypothetical protein
MHHHKIVLYYMEIIDRSIFVQDDFLTKLIFILIFLNMCSLDHLLYHLMLRYHLSSFIEMDHELVVMNQMMQHHPLNQLIIHHLNHHFNDQDHHWHQYQYRYLHHHHYRYNFMLVWVTFFHLDYFILIDFLHLFIWDPFWDNYRFNFYNVQLTKYWCWI